MRPGLDRGFLRLAPRALALLLVAGQAGGAARGSQGPQSFQDSQGPQVSERSLERLRYDCASEIDRRDLTLFANGTVRLRQGAPGIERMWLQELGRESLQAYLNRLAAPLRNETPPSDFTASGEWVERCVLELQLEGRQPERYEFDRFDTLSLDLQRTVVIAKELVEWVDRNAPAAGEAFLPLDYEASLGDVLRRPDGIRFRVNGFTVDGNGVELIGIEHPVTLYLAKTELSSYFAAVESDGS
ncbi:MAG TPA: hypothetical protein VMT85_07165 [Thermoanaerobaculia bacterium]|nr:hypothetical protein [Thermoanaerobaculia bacterium]